MVQELVGALVGAGCAGLVYLAAAARVVKQYERGVVFRFGRLLGTPRLPGFTVIVPMVDRLQKVNMQIVTLPIPAQEGITRDNVTVRVDAVVYFKVVDAANALIRVEDYRFAVSQMAQTSLRSIIGKSDLDDLLSNREKLNQGLELMIDSP
ncbi:SPFH domain-containing protein, partial [Streptomyces sp. NPDC055722]